MKANIRLALILLVVVSMALSCGGQDTSGNGGKLNPPANVHAANGRDITVSWDMLPGLCYDLYWNTPGGVTKADNKVEDAQSPYVHTGLIYNTTYYYAVAAVDCTEHTESGLSAEAAAFSDDFDTELLRLTASDSENGDMFGYAVSISGDYAIVGAKETYSAGFNHGTAYVYYRDQGGTDNRGAAKKLIASDAEDHDSFGESVSISGDYAIVGASLEDGMGTTRGAAYVFYRNQGGVDNWGEVTKLTASDAEDHDFFGYAVSISGDYIMVGAFGEDGAGGAWAERGAAYVFYRNQGGVDNWGEVTKLTASDAGDGDQFGGKVSISGDHAIVGASYEDGGGTDRGAAYVFYRDLGGPDNWGEVTKLTASDAGDYDEFGSVSIDGDYAVVGAANGMGMGDGLGTAHVFYRDQGGSDAWGEVTKLDNPDPEFIDWFGAIVSISGDYVVVGAPGEDEGGEDWGAAYVYNRNLGGTDNWGLVTRIASSDAGHYDWFGSVAISGDDIIVGASGVDGGGGVFADRGAAYLFSISAF